jgi:hypothetical protein
MRPFGEVPLVIETKTAPLREAQWRCFGFEFYPSLERPARLAVGV